MLVKNFLMFFLWMGVIIYLSFTPLEGWPKLGLFQKLYFDKLVHITMYSILCFLLLRGFYRKNGNDWPAFSIVLGSILFCAGMGATIEFLQPLLTMYRQFEWLDMVANATGAVCGYFVFRFIARQWLRMKAVNPV